MSNSSVPLQQQSTEPAKTPLRNSLFIVKNGQPVEMTIDAIFDYHVYDTFSGMIWNPKW